MRLAVQVVAGSSCLFFVGAAIAKFDDWDYWTASASNWIPAWLPTRIVRVAVPLIEVTTAAVLVTFPAAGLLLSSAVLTAFGAGVVLLTPSRRGMDCGCFGIRMRSTIGSGLAFRNLLLAAMNLFFALVAVSLTVDGFGVVGVLILAVLGMLVLLSTESRSVARTARERLSNQEMAK